MKFLFLFFSFIFVSNLVNAACIPNPNKSIQKLVAGKTFVEQTDDEYPTKLYFDEDLVSLALGSDVSGHPGGEYSYDVGCNLHILIIFKSFFGSDAGSEKVIGRLLPLEDDYSVLKGYRDGAVFREF